MRWGLASIAVGCALIGSTAADAQQYDSWMMNWFRSPSINGYPACVPAKFDPGETQRIFRRSNTLDSYRLTKKTDKEVRIVIEKVKRKDGSQVYFESASDHSWCINNYQREYWKMAAEVSGTVPPAVVPLTKRSPLNVSSEPVRGPASKPTTSSSKQDGPCMLAPAAAASIICLDQQLADSRKKFTTQLDASDGLLDAEHAHVIESINRRWSDLQEDQCALAPDQLETRRCEIAIYNLRTTMLSTFTKTLSVRSAQ